jgi:hypothetical protein
MGTRDRGHRDAGKCEGALVSLGQLHSRAMAMEFRRFEQRRIFRLMANLGCFYVRCRSNGAAPVHIRLYTGLRVWVRAAFAGLGRLFMWRRGK